MQAHERVRELMQLHHDTAQRQQSYNTPEVMKIAEELHRAVQVYKELEASTQHAP